MSDNVDCTPSERTAIVTLALARGQTLTPADVMRMTNCASSTAYDVLGRLARVIPIYESNGQWEMLVRRTLYGLEFDADRYR